jgi:diguanylate cyclase (GGDEF)-like protein/PAS domain S-box-containing protein
MARQSIMKAEKGVDISACARAVMDAIPSPVLLIDRTHRLVEVNDCFCAFTGRSREFLLGDSPRDRLLPEVVRKLYAAHDHVFATGEDYQTEEAVTDHAGHTRHVINRRRLIRLGGEDLIMSVLTDVTEFRQAEAQNRYLAFHDALTGLPNRVLLDERIGQALTRRSRGGGAALLFIDLDNFKDVNDSFGHPAGDELLRQFAARIAAVVRGSDTVARLGGDEFAILLSDTGGTFDAAETCRRVLAAAREPFELANGCVFVGASVGLVETGEGITAEELQRRADVALYEAKREGRACYRVFSAALDQRMLHRREIERDLRAALDAGDQFEMHYQPVIQAPEERLTAMEALVRWNHPRLGLLLPGSFIDVAEDSGLIIALGDWVLDQATAMMARFPDVAIAVNLSAVQLRSEGIDDRILEILKANRLAPQRLQLEITETAMLAIGGDVQAKLLRLRREGVQVVLDDFGTGYSSLSHLQRFAVDRVKIDQSFVREVAHSQDARAIIQAVLGIGQTLGIAVTAEGVELDAQRIFLRAFGCNEFQGYLFSRPLTREDAQAYLRDVSRPEREAA